VRLALLVLLVASTAHAYPQFQLSMGVDRCITCHYSPAGGGLINDYGRDEAGDTISRGGDGRFAHGLWTPPSWLKLGADLRGVGLVRAREPDVDPAVFPMQTDLYVRAGTERYAFSLTLGSRSTRSPSPPIEERLTSREHYFTYDADSWYARAGRFFPVFGIRSQDHTAFVRRYLGFSTLEEPYGVAAGKLDVEWEAHVSAFVPRPIEFLGAGVKASGIVGYYERRIMDDTAALAGQFRLGVSDDDTRVLLGVVGKRWLPEAELMVLAELDLQRQSFDAVDAPRWQLASYLGASTFVARGWMVGGAVHYWRPDLTLRSAREAAEVNVQYFPRAHLELHLLVRTAAEGDYEEPSLLSMLQLHYYL
jgi:hypothetical protein